MSDNVKESFYLPQVLDAAVEGLVADGAFTTKTDVYQEAVRRLLLDYDALGAADAGSDGASGGHE